MSSGDNTRGSLQAAVMDFSGTLIDPYVLAPATVFVEVFQKHGVEITLAEVRAPMGQRKDAHIKALLGEEAIAARWRKAHGSSASDDDVRRLYADFIPLQLQCLARYATPLPGAAAALATLRQKHGIKIAATSGFTREMIAVILAETQQVLQLDAAVGGDEVAHGSRPAPFMLYRALELMNITPISSVVKVDDSAPGIAEGLNAGCWTVGVSRYSNYMNMDSLTQAETMSAAEIDARHANAKNILQNAGAHYVVDSVADLPPVVMEINARLARGEKP